MESKKMNKKAEMGIGTLIIFIAMILVAAIAAGVLLQTASSLQNKALVTGERSKTQVSTGLNTILIYGEDGTGDHALEVLCQKLKLQPGSDSLKFANTLLSVQTKNASESLVYGVDLSNVTNETWTTLPVDLDDDGTSDAVLVLAEDQVANETQKFGLPESTWENASGSYQVVFRVSNSGSPYYTNVTLPDLSTASATNPVEITIFNHEVNSSATTRVGSFAILGKTRTQSKIDDSVYFFVGRATGGASGAYAVTYIIRGNLYKAGYLSRGDMVKMCYPAPRKLYEDESLKITIVPKTGHVHSIITALPDVITQKRVYIYP